jgi:hypothetical protein
VGSRLWFVFPPPSPSLTPSLTALTRSQRPTSVLTNSPAPASTPSKPLASDPRRSSTVDAVEDVVVVEDVAVVVAVEDVDAAVTSSASAGIKPSDSSSTEGKEENCITSPCSFLLRLRIDYVQTHHFYTTPFSLRISREPLSAS